MVLVGRCWECAAACGLCEKFALFGCASLGGCVYQVLLEQQLEGGYSKSLPPASRAATGSTTLRDFLGLLTSVAARHAGESGLRDRHCSEIGNNFSLKRSSELFDGLMPRLLLSPAVMCPLLVWVLCREFGIYRFAFIAIRCLYYCS